MIALNEIADNSLAYHTQMSSDLSHNDVSSYFGPSTKQSPAIEGLQINMAEVKQFESRDSIELDQDQDDEIKDPEFDNSGMEQIVSEEHREKQYKPFFGPVNRTKT